MSGLVSTRAVQLGASVVLAWTSICTAQQQWVVDSRGGSGVDFTDLPPAVAAASPGDTILLRLGTGNPYGFDLTIRRGIRIIGDDSVPIPVRGRCQLREIPDGDMLVIHNLELTDRVRATSLRIEDCDGLVVVSAVYDGYDADGGCSAIRSARLVLTNCRFVTPHSSMSFDESLTWLLDCDIRAPGPSVHPILRAGAVNVLHADLRIIGGSIKGPDGVGNDCGVTLQPEQAVVAALSRVILGGRARLEGGLCAASTIRWPAIYQSGNFSGVGAGWQVRDPNVTFIDAADIGFRLPVLEHELTTVFPRPGERGQRQTIDVIGPSNGIVSVYASLAHGHPPITLPIGDVWLDPALTLHVATGPVDAQRDYQASTTIPAWLPPGTALVYQAVALTSSNRFELSTPGFVVFR